MRFRPLLQSMPWTIRQPSDTGAVTVEACLVVPILFLLFSCVSDLYILIDAYAALVHISREATLGSSRLSITPAEYTGTLSNLDPTPSEITTCYQSAITGECAHKIAQWRLRRVLESSKLKLSEPLDIQSDISYVADLESSAVGYRIMKVQVGAIPRTLFPFFENKTIHVEASAGG